MQKISNCVENKTFFHLSLWFLCIYLLVICLFVCLSVSLFINYFPSMDNLFLDSYNLYFRLRQQTSLVHLPSQKVKMWKYFFVFITAVSTIHLVRRLERFKTKMKLPYPLCARIGFHFCLYSVNLYILCIKLLFIIDWLWKD